MITLTVLMLLFSTLSACSNSWWCKQTAETTRQSLIEAVDQLEFIAQLEPGIELESLQTAWEILAPELSWIGPPNSGFVKIAVSTEMGNTEQIINLFGATQGVKKIEENKEVFPLQNEL